MRNVMSFVHRNLANGVSILGVLPLCVLLDAAYFQYLIPLMVYNNVMDDLDGVLAAKLNTRSRFGAIMDNVCDSVSHSILVMAVGMHAGGVCAIASVVAVAAMVVRGVARLEPGQATGSGSPTNELIRHVFFVVLLSQQFDFNAAPILIVTFLVHTVSMHIPFKMPYLIRGMATSALSILLVNVSLALAWLIPATTPVLAACFFGSYCYSLALALIRRSRRSPAA